jgi:hypothetical protein
MVVQTDTKPVQDQGKNAAAVARLSLPRLYTLRVGYLVLGVGLALVKLPLFLHHDKPWTFTEGVMNCMLAALSILAFLGLRYPVQMLPVLLFESAWKLIWLSVIALPMWISDRMDQATLDNTYKCFWVVIILAAIPWRHVYSQYVTKRGDRWR